MEHAAGPIGLLAISRLAGNHHDGLRTEGPEPRKQNRSRAYNRRPRLRRRRIRAILLRQRLAAIGADGLVIVGHMLHPELAAALLLLPSSHGRLLNFVDRSDGQL